LPLPEALIFNSSSLGLPATTDDSLLADKLLIKMAGCVIEIHHD